MEDLMKGFAQYIDNLLTGCYAARVVINRHGRDLRFLKVV